MKKEWGKNEKVRKHQRILSTTQKMGEGCYIQQLNQHMHKKKLTKPLLDQKYKQGAIQKNQ